MNEKWLLLNEKLNALSVRERGILFATLLVLVLFIWLQAVFLPWEETRKAQRQAIAQAEQGMVDGSTELQGMMEQLKRNPNDPLREEALRLNGILADVNQQIGSKLAHLMPPQLMALTMQNVLADYSGLRLVSAKNLEVETLNLSDSGTEEVNSNVSNDPEVVDDDADAVVYSHGFEMTLKGNYFQTLEFIQRLEQLNGFFWHSLDYRVSTYPDAEITIRLNTLSLDKEWIGV